MHARRPITGLIPLAVTALLLSGCSTTKPNGSTTGTASGQQVQADAFPVSVPHALGSTEVTKAPTRVATLGWSDADVALALGVVPVGATKITWGGTAAGSTPWFDAKLQEVGGTQPTRYSDADGAPVDEIAKLAPDLILATQSGLTKQEYDKLSKIAPVVAYPKAAWATSWQDSLALVGKALGRTEQAATLRQQTEASISAAGKQYPKIKDKTFVFASLSTADKSKIDYYTTTDNRVRLLTELGMKPSPFVVQNSAGDQFFKSVSAEKANTLTGDIFVTYTLEQGQLATLRDDSLLGQIPAFKTGAYVDASNQTDVLGMSSPSPLAIPWTMEKFVPLVGAAASKAAG